MYTDAVLGGNIASASDKPHPRDKRGFVINVEGVPAKLVGYLLELLGSVGECSEGVVGCRWKDSVQPRLFVGVTRCSEGAARDLLRV